MSVFLLCCTTGRPDLGRTQFNLQATDLLIKLISQFLVGLQLQDSVCGKDLSQ